MRVISSGCATPSRRRSRWGSSSTPDPESSSSTGASSPRRSQRSGDPRTPQAEITADDSRGSWRPGRAERWLPQLLNAATGTQAESDRHAEAAKPPRSDDQLDNKLRLLPEDDPRRELLPNGPCYYLQHGHIYRCLDWSADCRRYEDKFWVGGIRRPRSMFSPAGCWR